jgi:hypothetical protein
MRQRSLRLAGSAFVVTVLLTLGTVTPALATASSTTSTSAEHAVHESTFPVTVTVAAAAKSVHLAGVYGSYDACDFAGFENWVYHNWYPWACFPIYVGPFTLWALYEWY